MSDIDEYYQRLGLKPGASEEEIKEAYRDLVNVWHPDRFSGNPRLREKANDKIKEINIAYEKLKSYIVGETFTTSEGKSYDKSQPPPHEPPPHSVKEQDSTTDGKGQEDLQPPPEHPSGRPQPNVMESIYAGFWNRFTAAFIDKLIIAAGSTMLSLPFLVAEGLGRTTSSFSWAVFDSILFMLIGWLYCTLLESSTKQATIGKMAVGIIVADVNGNQISFGRANGRWWGKSISFMILGIGFIMAGFTRKKQALHDVMADTLVLARPEGIRTWLTTMIIGGIAVIWLIVIAAIALNWQSIRTIDYDQTASAPSSSFSSEQPTSIQPPAIPTQPQIESPAARLNRIYGLPRSSSPGDQSIPTQPSSKTENTTVEFDLYNKRHPQFQTQPQVTYQKESPILALEYNNRGVECLKRGQYDEAIENLTMAISKDRHSYSAHINRGRAYYEKKQYQAAINDFKDATTLAPPNDATPYNWCGVAYYNMEFYYEAAKYFSQAISMAPEDPILYVNRGNTYLKMGITFKSYAISDLKKACELGDSNACNKLKGIS
jgi:uncharacterized RDD family membrane protein YckC